MAFRLEDWMRVVVGTRFPTLTLWSGQLRFGKARDWESAAIVGSEETIAARLTRYGRDAEAGRRCLRVLGDGPIRKVVGLTVGDDIDEVDALEAGPLWDALSASGVEGKITRADGVRWFAQNRIEDGQWKADRGKVFDLKKGACRVAEKSRLAATVIGTLIADVSPEIDAWLGANAEALLRLEHREHFGLVSTEGRVVISPTHTGLGNVCEGRVASTGEDGGTVRDPAGVVLLGGWNWFGECRGGLIPVTRIEGIHHRCGYVGVEGELVIPAQYEKAYPFEGNVALTERNVPGTGTHYRFVDRRGNDVGPTFDHTLGFSEGLAWVFVRSELRSRCIDETGASPFDVPIAGASPFASGRSAAIPLGETTRPTGYLDRGGRWVIEPRFGAGFAFRDERAIVKDRDRDEYFLVDAAGERVGKESFGYAGRSVTLDTGWVDTRWELNEGLAPARRADAFGFVNREGDWAIAPSFELVMPFSEGLAAVKQQGVWGAIDLRGEWAIAPELESLGSFSGGLAVASRARRFGHVNRRGEWIVFPEWKEAGAFSEGFAWVRSP